MLTGAESRAYLLYCISIGARQCFINPVSLRRLSPPDGLVTSGPGRYDRLRAAQQAEARPVQPAIGPPGRDPTPPAERIPHRPRNRDQPARERGTGHSHADDVAGDLASLVPLSETQHNANSIKSLALTVFRSTFHRSARVNDEHRELLQSLRQ